MKKVFFIICLVGCNFSLAQKNNSTTFQEFIRKFPTLKKIPDSAECTNFSADTISYVLVNKFLAGIDNIKSDTSGRYYFSNQLNNIDSTKLIFNSTCINIKNKYGKRFLFCDKIFPIGKILLPNNNIGFIIKTISLTGGYCNMYVTNSKSKSISFLQLFVYENDEGINLGNIMSKNKIDYISIKSRINADYSIDRIEYGPYDIKEIRNHYELDKNGVYVIRKQEIIKSDDN